MGNSKVKRGLGLFRTFLVNECNQCGRIIRKRDDSLLFYKDDLWRCGACAKYDGVLGDDTDGPGIVRYYESEKGGEG